MTDDELPPHARPTLPDLEASNDTDPPPPNDVVDLRMPDEVDPPVAVIPRGFAQHATMAALEDLQRAVDYLAATTMAIARQLDSEEP